MQEIQTNNELGLAVYINGMPKLELMSKEVMDELCTTLLSVLISDDASFES